MLRQLERLRHLVRRPWFIRVVYGQRELWEDANGDPNVLAGQAFSKTEESVSVYEVRCPIEELRAVAAVQLGRGSTPKSAVIAVRFSSSELKVAGIRVVRSGGTTGVPSVDRMHRDLAGNGASYGRLAEVVLERQRNGDDRVRRVGPNRLVHQFRRFLNNEGQAMSPRARKQCQDLVESAEGKGSASGSPQSRSRGFLA